MTSWHSIEPKIPRKFHPKRLNLNTLCYWFLPRLSCISFHGNGTKFLGNNFLLLFFWFGQHRLQITFTIFCLLYLVNNFTDSAESTNFLCQPVTYDCMSSDGWVWSPFYFVFCILYFELCGCPVSHIYDCMSSDGWIWSPGQNRNRVVPSWCDSRFLYFVLCILYLKFRILYFVFTILYLVSRTEQE